MNERGRGQDWTRSAAPVPGLARVQRLVVLAAATTVVLTGRAAGRAAVAGR
jgi:hypothetical protein